jgi:hypothetical protein
MNNVDNVIVGKPKSDGAIWMAPAGTTLPTDAISALPEAFKCLGYVSEDGVTNTNTPESEDIKAWGGDTVASPITGKVDKFSFTLIESLNVDALKLVYGADNVTGTLETGISIKSNSKDYENVVIVIERSIHGSFGRIVVPKAKVTEIGDITYVDNAPVGYPVTITGFPDSNGDTHHDYIAPITASILPIGG